jgi:hypothetical protein
MADIRINALATTAASTASDDFVAVDGSANGTRKLNAFSPTFGGNLTVNGGTATFQDPTNSYRVTLTTAAAKSVLATSFGGSSLALRTNGSATDALLIDSSLNTTLSGNLTVSGTQITNTGAAESTGNIRLSHASGGKVIRWASSNYNVDLYQSGDNDILRARVANFAISSDPTFATNYTTIAAGNIVTTGNLTVSGAGTSSFGGQISIAGGAGSSAPVLVDYYGAIQAPGGVYVNSDITTARQAGFNSNGTDIRVRTGNVDGRAVFTSGGNVLIGTTTDGGQKLQVNGTAAITGNLTVGNSNTNQLLTIQSATAGTGQGAALVLKNNTTTIGYFGRSSYISSGAVNTDAPAIAGTTGLGLNFFVNDSTNALALASTGAATFAGAVTVNGATASGINASGSFDWIASRANTSSSASYQYKTGATLNWYHGLRGLANNNWYLFNNATSANTLIFDAATDAATFAGTVTTKGSTLSAINNTNVSTTATDIAIATSVGGLYFVTGYNTSGGAQGTWLLMMRGSNVTTISSDNNTGLTVTYSVSAGKLQAATASGTIALIATAITR